MLEGCRLRLTVRVYRDLAKDQTITDYPPCIRDDSKQDSRTPIPNYDTKGSTETLTLPAGTRLLLDFTTASHDPAAFPDPEKVKLDRPIDSYMHYGWGRHQCLGLEASRVVLTAMFKSVVGLKGLRRADGPRGQLKSFPVSVWAGQTGRGGPGPWSGLRVYMTPDQSSYWPIPATMKIRWDA